jgi:salicylate hydroxylase
MPRHATISVSYKEILASYIPLNANKLLSRAQGAAQAVEDGAVLGALLSRVTDASQLPDVLHIYEVLRKSRTTRIVKGSTAMRHIFHAHDGPRQRERDRQLLEYQDQPFDGFPNRWRDPSFQSWLFKYDAEEEAMNAWNVYIRGKFPGATEGWMKAAM